MKQISQWIPEMNLRELAKDRHPGISYVHTRAESCSLQILTSSHAVLFVNNQAVCKGQALVWKIFNGDVARVDTEWHIDTWNEIYYKHQSENVK